MQLPQDIQKELVEKAAAKFGNCQELARHLNIPKSSVHYYRIGRLTMPFSLLERMLEIAADDDLRKRIEDKGITKDRTWANEYAVSVYREMCRDRLRLPSKKELEEDDELRRQAAAIVSYIQAEGSVWILDREWEELAANITFADHELDLYEHFRNLCKSVFHYDIGDPQQPGNGARAIRGFILTRFVAEWLMENGVPIGDKSSACVHLPMWVMASNDPLTWIAALQPWFDGEGGVVSSGPGRSSSIIVTQSRHTSLSLGEIPWLSPTARNRSLSKGSLAGLRVFDIPVLNYCRSFYRSEVLDDVRRLLVRLGFHPRMDVVRLSLKNDGYWSCVWGLSLGVWETKELVTKNLVTQHRKRDAIRGPLE